MYKIRRCRHLTIDVRSDRLYVTGYKNQHGSIFAGCLSKSQKGIFKKFIGKLVKKAQDDFRYEVQMHIMRTNKLFDWKQFDKVIKKLGASAELGCFGLSSKKEISKKKHTLLAKVARNSILSTLASDRANNCKQHVSSLNSWWTVSTQGYSRNSYEKGYYVFVKPMKLTKQFEIHLDSLMNSYRELVRLKKQHESLKKMQAKYVKKFKALAKKNKFDPKKYKKRLQKLEKDMQRVKKTLW